MEFTALITGVLYFSGIKSHKIFLSSGKAVENLLALCFSVKYSEKARVKLFVTVNRTVIF
jgi:hypothetical protein